MQHKKISKRQNFFHFIPNGSSGIFRVDDFNGRKSDPNAPHIKTIADSTNIVFRQPNFWIKNATSGANMNVPSPEPATAIPLRANYNKIILQGIEIPKKEINIGYTYLLLQNGTSRNVWTH